jgi:hypothetical protein
MGRWDLFGGLTYDQRRCRPDGRGAFIAPGSDVVKSHALRWLRDAPDLLGRPIEAGVLALEYQRNGWPHLHPLLRVAGGLQGNEIATLGTAWFNRHGGNRLEVPRDVGEVCAYASKYLAKDLSRGDVIFWPLRGPLSVHQDALLPTPAVRPRGANRGFHSARRASGR